MTCGKSGGPEVLRATGGVSRAPLLSGGDRWAVLVGPAWALGWDVDVVAPGLPGQAASGGGAGVGRG